MFMEKLVVTPTTTRSLKHNSWTIFLTSIFYNENIVFQRWRHLPALSVAVLETLWTLKQKLCAREPQTQPRILKHNQVLMV